MLFVFGAVLGSFLNVLIYRSVEEDEDWVQTRSRCDSCRKQIAWYDNIPLLSFLILRGKCRHCKKRIAPSHLFVELLTGAMFVWWYWGGFLFFKLSQEPFTVLQPLFWLFVAIVLLVIFVTDIRYYLIPDTAVLLLGGAAVVYRIALTASGIMQLQDLVAAVAVSVASALFFFALWFFTKGRGMGFGDVKLIAPLCLLMGWPRAVVGVVLSFVLGAVVGIILIALGKKKMKQPIPFGPFLIIATALSLWWGDALLRWYLSYLF